MTPDQFAALSRADKIRAVSDWNRANAHLPYASRAAARACAEHFGAPFNTVRGLFFQSSRFQFTQGEEGAETICCGASGSTDTFQTSQGEEDETTLPADDEESKPRDRAADAAAGREAARQPRPPKRKRRYYVDDDGLFQPVKAGEPLHICPTCGAQAFIHYELAAGFGIRNMGGVLRPQSLCRACRTNHGRRARQKQLDIVDAISNAAPAAPAEASAYQNPPGLAGLLGGMR